MAEPASTMSIEIEGTVPVTPEHSSRNATCRLEVGFAVSTATVENTMDENDNRRMKGRKWKIRLCHLRMRGIASQGI